MYAYVNEKMFSKKYACHVHHVLHVQYAFHEKHWLCTIQDFGVMYAYFVPDVIYMYMYANHKLYSMITVQ